MGTMIYASSSLIVGFGTEMISRCGNLVEVDHFIEKILSKSRDCLGFLSRIDTLDPSIFPQTGTSMNPKGNRRSYHVPFLRTSVIEK